MSKLGFQWTSGRFEELVAMTKGRNLLFPYLRRCLEGRALRAVGPLIEVVPAASDGGSPSVVVILSGIVSEVVDPPRWPREVFFLLQ